MGQPHNNDKEVTPENTLQLFKNNLKICTPYISSMVIYSQKNKNEKLILDKVLNLALKNKEYKLLDEMIKLVPDLESYMHEKDFINGNNCYVLPMGVDVEVLSS